MGYTMATNRAESYTLKRTLNNCTTRGGLNNELVKRIHLSTSSPPPFPNSTYLSTFQNLIDRYRSKIIENK